MFDVAFVLAVAWFFGPRISPLIEQLARRFELRSGVHGFWFTGPVLLLMYFALEALIGSSPGKRLLGMRVASEDGRLIQPAQSVPRFFVSMSGVLCTVAGIFLGQRIFGIVGDGLSAVMLLGSLLALGGQRRMLHDWLVGSRVRRA